MNLFSLLLPLSTSPARKGWNNSFSGLPQLSSLRGRPLPLSGTRPGKLLSTLLRTPGGLHLKPGSSLSSSSQGMSFRSSLPGSHFGGFPKILHLPHLLARGHRAATPKSTGPQALRSAPAHGIPSALGPPPAPRAAATGAAPGAQVPDSYNLVLPQSSKFFDPPLPTPGTPRVQMPARKARPPCDSTLDFPPGSPAITYPGRGPGAVAGSWRRCPGRPGPSTPLPGLAAPRRVSRLLLRPLPGPRAPDGVPGNESRS